MAASGDSSAILDPNWARSKRGRFHRFVNLDPEEEGLAGVSGVYVIWHAGIRPGWVYMGKSDDLAAAFHELGDNQEILGYEVNGGLFVSWSLVRPKHQDGVLRYLETALHPLVTNPDGPGEDVTPIPVYAPGHTAETN